MSESSSASEQNLICSFHKKHLVIESFPVGSLGCNTSLIYSPITMEAIIIDPGNDPAYLKKIIQQKKLQVKCLLHTHAHFDHIGGSGEIHKLTKAPIWLHKGDDSLYQALPHQGLFFGVKIPPPLPLEHFLEDEQSFGLQDPSLGSFLQTIFTPGHTPGSCSFYTEYFDHPILFSGDTLFNRSIGRTDLPGGDHHLILESIRTRLYTLPEETFCIPGHGPTTLVRAEKSSNPFIQG